MGACLSLRKALNSGLGENNAAVNQGQGTLERIPEQEFEFEVEIFIRAPNTNDDSQMDHEDWFELGMSRIETFARTRVANDIEEAIKFLTRALELTPDGHPSLPDRHGTLGVSYGNRYRHLGQMDDLDKSIEHQAQALALAPNSHPFISEGHANLGVCYGDRYQRLGQVDDLKNSIEHKSQALALTPDGHPSLPDLHIGLGAAYEGRYQRLGQVDDLEASIEHKSQALALTPDGHPSLADQHSSLGGSYSSRYRRLGRVDDLAKTIEHDSRALALTPDGHPSLSNRYTNLGVSYRERYQRLGQVADLEASIEHKSRALALTSEDHPSSPNLYANLAVSYTDQYRRLGQLEVLEKSIEHYTRALALTPNGHPLLSSRHANLGVAYEDRYRRLGQLDDLEASIEHKSRAVALTPDDHPGLPDRHANLGVSYRDRYQRLGQVEDLVRAIEHKSQALLLTPNDHPNFPERHTNLGVSYNDLYQRLGQVEDLEKSIEHKSRALALTPDGHPDLPDRYTNLAGSYSELYRRLGQADDIEQSIEHMSRALAVTPNGHPSLPDRYANLGVTYEDRYRRLGQVDDLDKVIEHNSHALALTPIDHPSLPARHFSQGNTFWLQYQHTGDASYLSRTLASFRNASQTLAGSPRDNFRHALQWANLSSENSSLNPIEAFQTTIDLLPQFVWLGGTTIQRYLDLATVEHLAIDAAFAAILASDHKLALEWLEHARCVVWNQTLMLRSPTHELQASHPDLADRIQTVATQLRDVSSIPSASQATPDPVNWEELGKQRRRLAKEYEDLLVEARTLPGFEDFLRPMKADRLVQAARYGPIVIVNCHKERSDALITFPGQENVQHLPLPGLTQSKAKNASVQLETSLRNKGVRARGFKLRKELGDNDRIAKVLLMLWDDVVKPVLEFLGYMNNALATGLPHITWCPTGALSFLPLHAAGDYDQPGLRVYNYAVSSYVPTLTSLFTLTPSLSDRTPRVLAIGQQYTAGHTPLPGTAKELACVANHVQIKGEYSELTGSRATTEDALGAMEKHDWVHLACHAHQNIEDPTKSGFFLHNGTLDLAAISRRSFKNKGLAFLSACQTATGDENLPDEAVHLASGMLMAGYPSVIATMWSVIDDDAPFVADGVYARVMKDGRVGDGEAGRALHASVSALRDKVGEREFTRWVPYIHLGS